MKTVSKERGPHCKGYRGWFETLPLGGAVFASFNSEHHLVVFVISRHISISF